MACVTLYYLIHMCTEGRVLEGYPGIPTNFEDLLYNMSPKQKEFSKNTRFVMDTTPIFKIILPSLRMWEWSHLVCMHDIVVTLHAAVVSSVDIPLSCDSWQICRRQTMPKHTAAKDWCLFCRFSKGQICLDVVIYVVAEKARKGPGTSVRLLGLWVQGVQSY